MRQLHRLCDALEDRPRLRGVQCELANVLKDEYEFAAPFLVPTGEEASRYPCPHPSGQGCPRHVFGEADGTRRAVCGSTPKECDSVTLNRDDVRILVFDNQRFARSIGRLLRIQAPAGSVKDGEDVATLGTITLASGRRLPVVLLMPPAAEAAEALAGEIESTYMQGAVLLTPTESFIDAKTEGRLLRSGFVWIVLADVIAGASTGLSADQQLVDLIAQRVASAQSDRSGAMAKDGCVFRKHGQVWNLTFDGESTTVKDAKGFSYIAYLLRNPRSLCLAVDLLAAELNGVVATGSAGEVIDSTAAADYRARADDLKARIAEADVNNDIGQKESLKGELEQLTDQILAAKGLGGRSRSAHDDRERIRKSVAMAIGRAIGAVRKHHPALADHLRHHIDRGHILSYSGDLPWTF